MLLLSFMTDFAKVALATDHVRPSKKPETWNIGGLVAVAAVLGVAMVAEALLFLYMAWSRFGLAANDNALYTFSFLTLLYLAVFPSCQRESASGSGQRCPAGRLSLRLRRMR
jgi:hypothetical protein